MRRKPLLLSVILVAILSVAASSLSFAGSLGVQEQQKENANRNTNQTQAAVPHRRVRRRMSGVSQTPRHRPRLQGAGKSAGPWWSSVLARTSGTASRSKAARNLAREWAAWAKALATGRSELERKSARRSSTPSRHSINPVRLTLGTQTSCACAEATQGRLAS